VCGDRLFTHTPYRLKDVTSGIPGGGWHNPSKCQKCNAKRGSTCPLPRLNGWHYPATPHGVLAVHAALQPHGYQYDAAYGQLLQQAREARAAGARRTEHDLDPIPGLTVDGWLHQRQAYWFGVAQQAALFDMEMGTGKSLVAVGLNIAQADKAAAQGRGFRGIVICPERVVGVWPREFGKWAAAPWHCVDGRRTNRKGVPVFMPVADRTAAFDQAIHECGCGRPHLVIANYSLAVHDPFATWALEQEWDAVTFDEVHRIKDAGGAWSKWATKLGQRARFRAGLTGTLAPHSPLDVFGPIRALDPGLLGHSKTAFQKRYALLHPKDPNIVKGLNPEREDELAEIVARIAYRAGPDVLDLPPEIPDQVLTCDLSPKARKVYAAVEGEMYAEVARVTRNGETLEDTISASNVLVKLIRMAQIAGGSVRYDSGVTEQIDRAKYQLLLDLLSDADPDKPVVVFCRFRPDLDRVAEAAAKLGRGYAELSGRRSDALAPDATLAPANADGEVLQIAGVQIQAGGTGIDFTRSHHAVYYSTGVSLGDYLQSRKRLVRPGQTSSVRFYHLVAAGTYDEDVYAALAAREQVAQHIARLIDARIAAGSVKLPPPGPEPTAVDEPVEDE
jgi:SNF2 family DNA or RNA helicase